MSRRARPCVARVFVCRRARATPPAHEAFSRTERRVARSVKKSTASSFTLQRARRDLKGAKVPRTCAVEKRSRAGFRPAAKCHRGGGTSKIDSREPDADEDTTGAIRLAGPGLGRRERALDRNLIFFPRLVAKCQIFRKPLTKSTLKKMRKHLAFLKLSLVPPFYRF